MDREESRFVFTRRRFIKLSSISGIWLTTRSLASRMPDFSDPEQRDSSWSSSAGRARSRFDGFAKVTGKKIYARDFRFKDMSDWPSNGLHAMVLRSPYAGAILTGLNLDGLPLEMRPARVITSVDLDRDGIVFPKDTDNDSPESQTSPELPGTLFAKKGEPVQFLGQPVAILLFDDFSKLGHARNFLRASPSVFNYGEQSPTKVAEQRLIDNFVYLPRLEFKGAHAKTFTNDPQSEPVYRIDPKDQYEHSFYKPSTRLTRYSDETGERFSKVLNGDSDPSKKDPVDLEAALWRRRIEEDVRSNGWKTISADYQTQQLDPMFMEPESGLAWFDKSSGTLHLVIGTQSTDDCVSDSIQMFGSKSCPMKIQSVVLNACYPGGGFGGRDVSTFSSLIAIAAAYSDGPVRMAYDRFDQFQSGIKQLGANIDQKLAIDSEGHFQAIISNYDLQAGGRNNYSQWVAQLAGYCGGSGYAIPRVIIDARARPSLGVIAGSMRGFGGPQSAFAVESLIDEAAIEIKCDPIELRRRNALSEGGYTVTGYRVAHSLRIREICERAQRNRIWVEKDQVREEYLKRGLLYGTGFALANQAFGTGCDGVMAAVELSPDGNATVSSNCIDMGNGSATSLAISTKKVGVNANTVLLGQTSLFDVLQLTSEEKDGKKDWNNPRYTPRKYLSSSSCITAFHQTHAVEQACRVILENGIWPVACAQWKIPRTTPFDDSKVRWENGSLVMGRNRPLSLEFICRKLYASGGLIGAMVHAAYLGQWIVGEFPVRAQIWRGPIDALAIRTGDGSDWNLVDRLGVNEPPDAAWNFGRSLYAPSAALSAVAVDPRTGEAKVLAVHSYLEAGRVVQPDLLMGQYYGAVAMGVGFAFHEECPQTDGGPGEGDWNLHRYHVPHWKDLPLDRITLELLDPHSPDEPPRGIAEAVLCPIAPALSNAVGSAIGKRFRSLPITANKILEALG